jgi:hypothetical protein
MPVRRSVFWALLRVSCFGVMGCSSVEPALLTPIGIQGEKDRIMAMKGPRYSGSGEPNDRQRFLDVTVTEWARYRVHRTDRLRKRYEAAISESDAPSEKAELFRDMARLEWELCREFFEAHESAFLNADGDNGKSRRSYFAGVVSAMSDRLDLATRAAVECVENSKPTPTLTRAHCEKVEANVVALRQTWLPR